MCKLTVGCDAWSGDSSDILGSIKGNGYKRIERLYNSDNADIKGSGRSAASFLVSRISEEGSHDRVESGTFEKIAKNRIRDVNRD